jgi:AcrR family transcriptional regulator
MSTKKVLDGEIIAAAALEIADSEGFEAVSMRRIAQKLGAGTMSLYYYVKSKAELLAAMDDALMAELIVSNLPDNWRAAMRMIAARTRDLYIRHPWALNAMLTAPPGVNAMRHAEQCLEALSNTPMTTEAKLTLLAIIDDFVFGYALREASGDSHVDVERAKRLLASGEFPQLAQAYGKELVKAAPDRFQIGLDALLETGMNVTSGQTPNPPPSRTRRARKC